MLGYPLATHARYWHSTYAVSGTDAGYAPTHCPALCGVACALRSNRYCHRLWSYAVRGPEIGYAATRLMY
eukprot:2647916-Rhodomonas_salina.1